MSLSLYPYLSDIMLILPHIILNTKPRLFFPQNICLHQDFYFLANFIEDSVEHKKESDQELDFYFLFFGQTSIIFLLHLFLLFSLSLSWITGKFLYLWQNSSLHAQIYDFLFPSTCQSI